MKYVFISPLFFLPFILFGQNIGQTVKGIIIDQQSELPLIGVNVQLLTEQGSTGTVTDENGYYRLENIPLGRQAFQFSYLGYDPVTVNNIEVGSGKEVVLDIQLTEAIVELATAVVKSSARKDRAQNELATISARQFSMEEVNRFSGGRGDVGRLASNFAGVGTADDSRNDIVIRGNSPTGVLWRLEGIPIPSPNHFSTIGTTGGPVSALNTNILKNSDFITSAFPAEYGDALSGVFDLGMRNGNKDQTEFMLQLGAVTGIEANAEGPLNKKNNGSYLIAGRYSFIGVAQSLGLDVGTNAVPTYYDLALKLNFGNGKLGNISLFGVGGRSNIDFLREEVDETDIFAADDEDARADSEFGVIGLRHNIILNDKSYLRNVVAVSTSGVVFGRDRYYNLDTPEEFKEPFVEGDDQVTKFSFSSFMNTKFNARMSLRTGFLLEFNRVNLENRTAELGIDADNNNTMFTQAP